jgi:1-deoxy-D-xylulose-5-phosphate reductoisomerase
MTFKKTISIFGSTGSIGKNALEIVNANPDKFKIIALVAKSNYKLLIKQAIKFQPSYVVIADHKFFNFLKIELSTYKNIKVLSGDDSGVEVAKIICDLVISAIVGIAGMIPTLKAIQAKSNIALANKEAMVCAGKILNFQAKKNQISILPIDSEHNAIFQIFEKQNFSMIDNITLTASGGPFFNSTKNLKDITIQEALKHPKWRMGNKISIDSATMMNKGLEVIEAYYFFNLPKDKINIIIHPQSIIHGMVNYSDGSTLSMMSLPDMKVPISYVMNYPDRLKIKHKIMMLDKISRLEFYQVDHKKFPAVKLCYQALKQEDSSLVVLNSANEIAVAKFLQGIIRFDQIYYLVAKTLEKIAHQKINSIEEIIEIDKIARNFSSTLKI